MFKSLFFFLFSSYWWMVAGIITLTISTADLFLYVLLRRRNNLRKLNRAWAWLLFRTTFSRLQVWGNTKCQDPLVVISTHRSLFDIPLLGFLLPLHFNWISRKEIFRIPLMGQAMRASGYLSIDRENPMSAYRTLKKAMNTLRENKESIVIFPEGTRNKDPVLLPFKRGFTNIAARENVLLLPVVIYGTEKINTKGSFFVCPSRVSVIIMNQRKAPASRQELELLQKEMQQCLNILRKN